MYQIKQQSNRTRYTSSPNRKKNKSILATLKQAVRDKKIKKPVTKPSRLVTRRQPNHTAAYLSASGCRGPSALQCSLPTPPPQLFKKKTPPPRCPHAPDKAISDGSWSFGENFLRWFPKTPFIYSSSYI